MDELRVSSWAELNEALYEHSWRAQIDRFRSPYAFRGVTDASSDLGTSLSRLGASAAHLESAMLRNFRKYAQRDAVPHDALWNWLAVAQHHGLPTRLLDWTYSPFVALHFATADLGTPERDVAVTSIDYVRAKAFLPDALRSTLRDHGSDVFTAEMLQEVAPTLHDFDALAQEPFLVFFEPPSLDERIVNQFALFSVMNDASARLDTFLEKQKRGVRRLIVPGRLKQEVRDKLDQANITERVLFPGLDGLTRWLRRYYNPRPPGAPAGQ